MLNILWTLKKRKLRMSMSDLLNDCCSTAEKGGDITSKLKDLAHELSQATQSKYCAIGIANDEYAEDIASTKELSEKLRRSAISNPKCSVCRAIDDSNESGRLLYSFGEDVLRETENFENYKSLLGEELVNTTVILIKDNDKKTQGYIQLLNSKNAIKESDYEYHKADLLRLVYITKLWCALKNERKFSDDAKFIDKTLLNRGKQDFLQYIMEYLSKQFHAGIVSFRIPLLVGVNHDPVFFLRECYVHTIIPDGNRVRDNYFSQRIGRKIDEMGGSNKLTCRNIPPYILCESNDTGLISDKISFKKDAVIIPIVREYAKNEECEECNESKNINNNCPKINQCHKRFENYYGVFRLRLLKNDGEDDDIAQEDLDRLSKLARHISVLLNAIEDGNENKALKTFQDGLKETSLSDNKDFDKQSAKIIKKAANAVECAIYRYDKLSNLMYLSASTAESIMIDETRLSFSDNLDEMMEDCGSLFKLEDKEINTIFTSKEPAYYVRNNTTSTNTMMLAPMTGKDGARIGMIVLIGKNAEQDVSKTYWDQDKRYIKFIVDILTRIVESDNDKLTFLIRLSHELRRPITEMVYQNDLWLSTAERNPDLIPKRILLSNLRGNMNSCMMYKDIIEDIEATYSASVRKDGVTCKRQDIDVKACLLDVIRLYEQGGKGREKGLIFETRLSNIPETLYVDKERIKQVFNNLLRNAIQYSDNYTTITISYHFNEDRGTHEIDFSNYGIGVDKDEKYKIFSLWRRGKSAIEVRPEGTGMGLSVVKEIMEKHYGDCYVKRLNHPTIFTVSIPQKTNQ